MTSLSWIWCCRWQGRRGTGHAGTVVLTSRYGPLLPAFSQQKIGNALSWGLVHDTPGSFAWQIGHTSEFSTPAGQCCVPGQAGCGSYDTAHWLSLSPLRIESVTFANGSAARKWAVVSDFGGTAEVSLYCRRYGGSYCTYPWSAFKGTSAAFTYGAGYLAPGSATGRPPSSRPPPKAAARSAPVPSTATLCSARPPGRRPAGLSGLSTSQFAGG
jgi:hypothetical protein